MSSSTKNSHSSVGTFVLIHSGHIVVFGDQPHDDMVVLEKTTTVKYPALYKSGKRQTIARERLDQLMHRVHLLTHASALAQFSLNADLLGQIKEISAQFSTTHMRMFSNEEKLRIVLFDCRMNVPSLSIKRSNSLQLHYFDLDIRLIANFSCTLKSTSFAKIPIDDYVVRIGDNSICALVPAKKSVQYLIRDQEIQEAIVNFQSPLVGADIVFAPETNF